MLDLARVDTTFVLDRPVRPHEFSVRPQPE
jgi:hypothetical protein